MMYHVDGWQTLKFILKSQKQQKQPDLWDLLLPEVTSMVVYIAALYIYETTLV